MAFESLTERLQGVFKNLRRKGKLSEKEVQEVTKEIRLALLEADVALPVVKTFIKRVRERAVGHEIIDTLDASQQIIKIVNEELTEILGSETSEIEKSPKIPTIIMMVGLQGAGKTTFAGKLANKLIKEQEARPMMIAADIYRPAAIDQLKTLGQQINVPVFDMGTETPAVEIVKNGLEQARANKNDYVLIDTAGRLQIDETLMQELHDIAFDTAFIAASGIDENGAYLLDQGDAEIVGLAVSRARKVILVAEHQKFVNKSYYRICPLDKISMFITDKALTPEQRAMFTDKTEIIVAN
mgnify:CR=1 FL=1